MVTKTRILIAEDHVLIREGLRALLSTTHDLDIVGEAEDGRDALEQARQLVPDIILMDLSMPNTNGTEAIRLIKNYNPAIKIIVLTAHKTEEYARSALNAGADGYVLKDDSHQDLLAAICSVRRGKNYLSPGICGKVVNGFLDRSRGDSSTFSQDELTEREREIIKLVAEGRKTREIANYLSISIKTVEKHRANLMRKLDLHNVSALTAYAIENQLVTFKRSIPNR